MAQRRMFSKSITNSSQFLMMPHSSQNLYFHLGMNADDDGFCEHFTLMRMTDSKPDDLKILQAKGYVTVFDDKVLVITDWKENNYLRNDRYTPSKYLEVYSEEIKRLSVGIPTVDKMATQDRLGKVRKEDVAETSSATAKGKKEKAPVVIIDFVEKMEKYQSSPQRHIEIIGLYMEYRKDSLKKKIKNSAQLKVFTGRHLKAAKQLADMRYNDEEILDFFEEVNRKNKDIDWTIETVIKHVTK